MKKHIAAILALALCLAALAGCGSQGGADPGFDAVAEAVRSAVGTEQMAEQNASFVANRVGVPDGSYENALVMVTNMGTALDEFGLFKAADEASAETIHSALQDYLSRRLESDAALPYHPEELPKLQNAKIVSEGSYVLYLILSEDVKTAAGEAFTACFAG